MKSFGLLSVAFAAALAVACGGDGRDADVNNPANDNAAVGTAGSDTAASANRAGSARMNSWVEDRLMGGMAEVKLGELASTKAQNAHVKAFGRTMVQDHTKAGEELKQIASQLNIQPPVQLDDDHRDKVERLSKLQGAEFDREYINMMVDDHEKTLNALEDRLEKQGDDENPRYTPKTSDDPSESRLNRWAAQTVPTVRQHLQKARQLDEKLGRGLTNDNER